MDQSLAIFLFVAGIIFIGFLGTVFFRHTKISDFVLLLLLGLLLGPVFGIVDSGSIDFLRDITPFFASLALMILLFEGGLQLNFFRVLKELQNTTLFSLFVFLISVAFVSAVLVLFGWNPLLAVMVGCVLGGSSSEVVVSLVNNSSAEPKTKTIIVLESAITDALCVIATLAMAQIILAGTLHWQTVVQNLFSAFSIATVLGLVFGVLWLRLLRDFASIRPYEYVLSMAMLFLVFVITEFANGNGAFSALVFGIVLGNGQEISRMFQMRFVQVDSTISNFHTEISLFVRTFFFVYLGIVFSLASLNTWFVLLALLLTFVLLAARWIGTAVLVHWVKEFWPDRQAIRFLMGRGLAAGVLATYPLTLGIQDPHVRSIVDLTFLVILFSNLLTTYGLFRFEKQKKAETLATTT